MQSNSLKSRPPVFSYTKNCANPPFCTINEQCFWSDISGVAEKFISFDLETVSQPKRRPKSSYCPGFSKSSLRWNRPSSACVNNSSLNSDEIRVTGEKYQSRCPKYHLVETNDNKSQSEFVRPSTPDYMEDVYSDYANKLMQLQKGLLRRPLSSKPLPKESSPVVVPPLDIASLVMEDLVDEASYKSASSPGGRVEDVPADRSPSPKPKLTIDISLCDGAGSIIGMPPPNSPVTDRSTEQNRFSDGEEVLCYTAKTKNMHSDNVTRPKTAATKSKRRPVRNAMKRRPSTAKRSVVEMSSVVVDYSACEFAERPTSAEKGDRNNKMTKRKKHPDEDVVTQMSALGLAKPLADDDLQKMITKKTASRKLQTIADTEHKADDEIHKQNQSKKFSGRKIPIQVISDPFKVRAGDRAIHRDGVTSPYQVSVAASNSSPNHPAPTKQRTGSSFSSCNDRVNDVYRPNSRRQPSTAAKNSGTGDQFREDVRDITDKLLRAGMRLSPKQLQKCLQSSGDVQHEGSSSKSRRQLPSSVSTKQTGTTSVKLNSAVNGY